MASKKLEKMSNTDLEEYCLQKICEVLIYKSEVADLRDQLQKQESLLEKWRKEYRDLAKQTRDLEIVHKKLMDELKRRPSKPESVEPVKITRSVGLQVKLYDAASAASPMKRRFSRGQETPLNNTPVVSQANKPAPRTTVTPTPQRQAKVSVYNSFFFNFSVWYLTTINLKSMIHIHNFYTIICHNPLPNMYFRTSGGHNMAKYSQTCQLSKCQLERFVMGV